MDREERNFTKSLILPFNMNVKISRKMQARLKISDISAVEVGRSRRVSGSMIEGREVCMRKV